MGKKDRVRMFKTVSIYVRLHRATMHWRFILIHTLYLSEVSRKETEEEQKKYDARRWYQNGYVVGAYSLMNTATPPILTS